MTLVKKSNFVIKAENWLASDTKEIATPFISFFWSEGAYVICICLVFVYFQIWWGNVEDVG